MSAREPDLLFNVRRTKDLRIFNGVGNVATESANRVERQLLCSIAMFIPVALSEGVRNILREDAHRVPALWRNARIVNALEVKLAPEFLRETACFRRRKTP